MFNQDNKLGFNLLSTKGFFCLTEHACLVPFAWPPTMSPALFCVLCYMQLLHENISMSHIKPGIHTKTTELSQSQFLEFSLQLYCVMVPTNLVLFSVLRSK